MSKIKDLEQLKNRAAQMQQEKDRAQGALEQAKKQLKEKFKVDTLEEADKLLKELEAQEESAKTEFEGALEKFEEEWGDDL